MICGMRPALGQPAAADRSMEITARALWTLRHGMGFGALSLLACSGALVEMYRFTTSFSPSQSTPGKNTFLRFTSSRWLSSHGPLC
jgi:hypothetical protein